MKKITIGLVAFAATAYSSAVLADTPTVREMNSFDHIQTVSSKNRALTNNASEFVIYHQDGHPCPPKHAKGEKGKKEHGKKHHHEHKAAAEEGKHHHHHHHHAKKDAAKKSEGAAKVAPKAAAPAEGAGNQ